MAAAATLFQSELSSDKMDPVTTLPLSPTASSPDGQMPQGFEDLVHHNNATSCPRDNVGLESVSVHTTSQPGSRMSTPAPHAGMSPRFAQYGIPQHQQQSMYANYTYQTQPGMYDAHDGAYPSLSDEVQPAYTTPASSPSQRSDIVSLRNGTVPGTSSMARPITSKPRVQKSPTTAPKKKKKGRNDDGKPKPHLEKPLSEMGDEWKESMRMIEAYINRSAEARIKETESDRKQPGKIKRPMNSFMLYRKAFQNHTKVYCEHNNHQVVSKVCGASWEQEPDHIRKQFADWAKLERSNHQKAHPGYKFTPAKPKNAKRKHDSDEETSDLETFDWESGPRPKRLRSSTGTPVPEHEVMYAPQQHYYSPQQFGHQPGVHPNMMPNRALMSSYGYNNPNKQMPAPYGAMSMGQPGQYLSSNSMANQHYQQRGYAVEDVSYHKTPSPGLSYQQGVPHGLMDSYSSTPQHHLEHTPPPAQFIHGQLDSALYPANDGHYDPNDPLHLPDHTIEAAGMNFNFADTNVQQQLTDGLNNFGGDNLLHDQQAQHLLRGNNESWDIQPLEDAQAGEQYDEWGVDPSLSQPYAVHDPALSESYAQD